MSRPAGLHVVQVVRSDGFAGVERYVADTAGELARRGCRVEVIGGAVEQMRAELPPDVRHHRGDTVAQVLRALWRIGRADVVHAHMTAAEVPAALLTRAPTRLIVTRHFAASRGASRAGRLAARFVARRVDVQIAISEFVARALGEPSVVIHNGVRPSESDPGTAPPVRTDTVVVAQRLEPEKDTELALRAWAASGLAAGGWRLVIHGRGNLAAPLHELAGALGLGDSVEFAGFATEPRAVFARSAMLLATAPAEPFGLTVVEGMAEGIAVVAADGGAHRETLGAHGAFFPAGDVDGCARRLRELADAPDDRAAAGAALRARFTQLFTLEKHVDALLRVYAP